MKKSPLIILILVVSVILCSATLYNAGVIISENENDTADPSAIFDIKSTTQGFLAPRLTSGQRDAIDNPAEGLEIYNCSRKCKEFYTGSQWTSASPAGIIHAYGGNVENIPNGWLLCDGSEVSANDYPDLINAIANNWGGSYPNFKLPDLRGQFLRGVNHQRSDTLADPDAENRIPNGAGNSNEAGSLQQDAIRNITGRSDRIALRIGGATPSSDGAFYFSSIGYGSFGDISNWSTAELNFDASMVVPTANDNHPKNAYVNFIIKF